MAGDCQGEDNRAQRPQAVAGESDQSPRCVSQVVFLTIWEKLKTVLIDYVCRTPCVDVDSVYGYILDGGLDYQWVITSLSFRTGVLHRERERSRRGPGDPSVWRLCFPTSFLRIMNISLG